MKKQTLTAFSVLGALLIASFSANASNAKDPQDTTIAREASEGPRGGNNERPVDRQGRGRYMIDQPTSVLQLAREASEGPRGGNNERPGDRQGRGRYMIEQPTSVLQLAREASEGPRGGDNERPGDRQRRGGRG